MTGLTPNKRTTQEIDENLRRVFREKEDEALPDRFTSLLNQLRAQDGSDGSEKSGGEA
ncbi:NepR family anti-sigma factor [Jannaschia sp. 2305UL9-9]|uniref:NepR family anti-sigma factor n=1 Tax=Jannaschia sp. 2305UL9-9 TaxID=3121638 RepID=UPI003526E692